MDKSLLLRNSRFLVLALLAVLVAAGIYFFRAVILPFAVAAFLAYLISPIVDRLAAMRLGQRTIHRGAAILLVYAVALSVLVLGGAYFVPKLTSEANRLVRVMPAVLLRLESEWIVPVEEAVNRWLEELAPLPTNGSAIGPADGARKNVSANGKPAAAKQAPAPAVAEAPPPNGELTHLVEHYTYVVRRLDENRFEVVPKRRELGTDASEDTTWDFRRQFTGTFGQLRSLLENNMVELLQASRTYVVAVVSSFFTTFLVLMVSAFILVDPQRINQFMVSLVPSRHQPKYEDLVKRLDVGLSGVVRGQVAICLINGTLTGVGIAIIGVPFVVTLTFIATIFSLIPIFGVLISTVPIMLMAITVSFSTAVLALGWILLIHFFEGNFLNPKIMGDSSHIHPVLIVFALVAGQYLGGILGALVAVPIFSVVQSTFLFMKGLAEKVESAA